MFTDWLLIPRGGMKMEIPCRVNMKKESSVTAPAREKLSNNDWKIFEPEASSKGPLVVQFPKPLDHVLALKYIVVTDAFNNIIQGKSRLTEW